MGDSVHVAFCTIHVKLCQILSHAAKRLSSAKALRQSFEDLLGSVCQLENELAAFTSSVKHIIQFDSPLDLTAIPIGFTVDQTMSLYFLYYMLLLEIHTPLTIPWFGQTSSTGDQAGQNQVERSSSVTANACRALILATGYTRLDANASVL